MISVIIPTYNRFELLDRAIKSVLNQTFKEFEIIVIDDCSADERYGMLLNDEKINYKRLSERSGNPAKVRNIGIKLSKYPWIAFLDDDDFWYNTKLEEQVKYIDKYDFICSEASSHDSNWATQINKTYWDMANPENNYEFNLEIIKKHNLIINSSVLVKKKLLSEINYIPEESDYHRREDYETWLRILQQNIVCFFIKNPLIEYNTSSSKNH